MRISSMLVLALSLASLTSGGARASETISMAVHADPGVLGRRIPVTITISNPTADSIGITDIQFTYLGKRLVPGANYPFQGMVVPPGGTQTYAISLLWNAAPPRVGEAAAEFYSDPIIFRRAGTHTLTAKVWVVIRHERPANPVSKVTVDRLREPQSVVFSVDVASPRDRAGKQWWRLVQEEPACARFLDTGSIVRGSPKYTVVMARVGRFVAQYPNADVARELAPKYKAATQAYDAASNQTGAASH